MAEPRTIGHFERMLHLRRLPVLGTLPPALLSALAENTRERFFPRGTVVQREDEHVGAAFYLVEGEIELHRGGALVGRLGAGCELGGLRLLSRDALGPQATAAADTLTLEIEGDALFELFDDEFPILHHILREVCRGLIEVQKRGFTLPAMRADIGSAPPGELDLVERIFYLRQSPPLERASINALAELSRGLLEVRFDHGTVLWEAGHAAEWVLLVVDGEIECTLLRGQRFVAGPGAPLGALDAVAEVPRWYTAVARGPVRALQGSIEGLIDVFEDNFEMALEYLSAMARLLLRSRGRGAGYNAEPDMQERTW